MSALIARLRTSLNSISRARPFYTGGRWSAHATSSLFLEQVVGRDHCLYVCVDLTHIPNGKRQDALKYQISSHSPWSQVNYQVAWHGGYAQLWLWPSAIFAGSASAAVCHAEPVFWPTMNDGLRLVKCANGFDLQYFVEGRLQASRWYASEPDLTQQQWFARSQGQRLGGLLPVQSLQISTQPWPSVRINPLAGLLQHPAQLVRWGGFLLLLVISLETLALLQWRGQAQQYQTQREQLELQLSNVLEQRNQARYALSEFDKIKPLLAGVDPLLVQQIVTSRLATVVDYQIVSWSRQDLQVELIIEAQVDSVLSIVNAVRGAGISDVQIEPSHREKQYRLQLTLAPELLSAAGEISDNLLPGEGVM